MAIAATALSLLFIVSSCLQMNEGSISLSQSLMDRNEVDGNRKKFIINLNSDDQNSGDPAMDEIGKRFRRAVKNDLEKIKSSPYAFNDKHFIAEVHWSGANSSSIMVLMRDPDNLMSSSRPSNFYVSRDYGKTYTNVTGNFTLSDGSLATISSFFSSKADNRKYILVAKYHRVLFVSDDECKTFRRVSTTFYPSEVKYHPRYSYYVALHEKEMGSKRLYTSTNNGRYWRFKASDVESYTWSYYPPVDTTSYLYYFKHTESNSTSGGTTGILYKGSLHRSYYWYSSWRNSYYNRIMVSGIQDYTMVNQFIFAVKNGTKNGTKNLLVSTNRNGFESTNFPFTNSTSMLSLNFLVADASENETFVAVAFNNKTANLYISDFEGKKYSLALENVLYFNKQDKGVNRFFRHDFVELHRVLGVSGVYIATNLTQGKPGTRHLQSWITFNKGGDWSHIVPPPELCTDSKKTGSLCALQLSQEFGFHNPYTRFTPIYSKKSAPGFILATGNVGPYLNSTPNVFLSTDAGISWRKILDGHYYYAFVDHGGIIVGAQKYGYTDTLKFSWDEGHSWQDYKFSKDPVRVYGLLTEPGEKSAIFTVYASKANGHSWFVIQVDFRQFLGRPCDKSKDYYLWELGDLRNDTQHCSLGKKQKYERRLADHKCYNGYNYDRAVEVSNCLCTREDFMCDFGFKEFVLGWFGTFCFPDINFFNATIKQPSWCQPGLLYNISSGYRKIPGDTCEGGDFDKKFLPETRACHIDPIDDFVLYAKSSYIMRYDLKSHQSVRMHLNGMKNVISLDYDYAGKTLFYADITLDRIMRMNLTTGHLHEVLQFDEERTYVEGIAYDWMNKDIYYTDVGSAEIGIISVDGRFKKKLFGPSDVGKPRGIAVHPAKGVMAWTDLGSNPSITIANMDGSGKKNLLSTSQNIKTPNDVAFDYESNLLYWTDSGMDRIERIQLDGRGRKVIQSSGVSNPYSLDIYKQKIVWDDWSYGGVQLMDKESGDGKQNLVNWLYKPTALRAFWEGKQKLDNNPCAPGHHNCTFKCLPANGKPSCVCPEGLKPVSGPLQCKCPNEEVFDRKTNACRPPKNETCTAHQFTCTHSKECIPDHWKCDGDKDCGDGSDEWGCAAPEVCKVNQFRCANGACILRSWKCDNEEDCSDGSDEKNCTTAGCAVGHVKCPTSECIPNNWVCDGEDDCADGWDEKDCSQTTTVRPTVVCPATQFGCIKYNRYRCLSNSFKCNGDNDCDDGSDERGCAKVICSALERNCDNGLQCIARRYWCNGWPDCNDGSDENNCAFTTPPRPTSPEICSGNGTYPCDNRRRCYGPEQRCNGIPDCNDGADEKGCPTRTTPRPTIPGKCKGYQCKKSVNCIGYHQTCDGRTDCPHGDDEWPASCACTFRCPDNNACATRCNGIPECKGKEDEAKCDTEKGKVDCALPSPFSKKCDGSCFNITVMCDDQALCDDASDEPADCTRRSANRGQGRP
uniref:VPS10 domain-containing protein n=1 Tax=Clytia hemisphaerica TaxID=252671 RepID=A0A7M5UK89_9CNID